jgi:4-amino-4-deoxy-L-arabinose transferase-like glycosyltransferase
MAPLAVPLPAAGSALAWLARRPYAVLFLLCLTLWLPGVLSLPPLDRDESRFAQSSKQMLETDNFIDIRFGAVPRYKKPAGIYWLQAATTAVAGLGHRDHIWTYRLPSLIGAMLAVWLAFWCARAFAGAEVALLGAMLLAGSLLLTAEATIATTDAALLACILGAQGVLLRAYLAAREAGRAPPTLRLALMGWAAFALGILVKGPVEIAVCGITVLALVVWERKWRWLKTLRPFMGIALAIVLVAPWMVAIAIQSHGQFYEQSLGHDFATKLQGGQETHGAPPGYYLLLTIFTFWPATLFLIPAVAAAIMRRGEPAVRFLIAWAASNWLMFEIVPTKLPHYILPVYPALAMLAALWALGSAGAAPQSRWQRGLFYLAPIQFLLGAAAFAAAPIVLPRLYGAGTTPWLIAAAALAALLAIGAVVALLRRENIAATACVLCCALVLYPTLALGVVPRLPQLWISPRAAALVAKDAHRGDPPPALAGYEEPSLVFLLGTETRLTNGFGAAEAGAGQGGLVLIEDAERPGFLAHLAELGAGAEPLDTLDGLNYSRGRRVHITVYRVAPVHQVTAPPPE